MYREVQDYEYEMSIERRVYGSEEKARFYNSGEFADGHLAYSKMIFDKELNKWIIEDEEDGMYAQVRWNGHLVMYRI